MKRMHCPQEAEVTKAARAGNLEASLQDASLRAHTATCDVCRGVIEASSWMQALAQAPGSNRALPDASLVYWRARLSEQEAEAEKAQDILDWAELAAGAGAAGLAGWGVWHWVSIQGSIASLDRGLQFAAGIYSAPGFLLAAGGAFAVLALVVVLTYPELADE